MKLKNHLPSSVYNPMMKFYDTYINQYFQKSYAQEGEDIILYRMLYSKIDTGFYIDVGAHHPKRFSNTYFFYRKGWRGINIEPMPGSKVIFDRYRPRDINLEIPISSNEQILTYYMFNDPALNSFSKEISLDIDSQGNYKIIKTIEMKTRTLGQLLKDYLPKGQKIDLLNVDVEGLDLDVLKSNDWVSFQPNIILSEEKGFDLENPDKSELYKYLTNLNYHLISKTLNTLIFQKL